MLTVIDEYSRECLAIRTERRQNQETVLETLADLFLLHRPPDHIRSDNVLRTESRVVPRQKDAFAATGPQIFGALADIGGFRRFGVCSRP